MNGAHPREKLAELPCQDCRHPARAHVDYAQRCDLCDGCRFYRPEGKVEGRWGGGPLLVTPYGSWVQD